MKTFFVGCLKTCAAIFSTIALFYVFGIWFVAFLFIYFAIWLIQVVNYKKNK